MYGIIAVLFTLLVITKGKTGADSTFLSTLVVYETLTIKPQVVTYNYPDSSQLTVQIVYPAVQPSIEQDPGRTDNFNLLKVQSSGEMSDRKVFVSRSYSQNIDDNINQNNQHSKVSKASSFPPKSLDLASKKPENTDRVPFVDGAITVSPVRYNLSENTTNRQIPNIISEPKETMGVSFEQRSSFEGDKCPEGFVRINGTCVEKD